MVRIYRVFVKRGSSYDTDLYCLDRAKAYARALRLREANGTRRRLCRDFEAVFVETLEIGLDNFTVSPFRL